MRSPYWQHPRVATLRPWRRQQPRQRHRRQQRHRLRPQPKRRTNRDAEEHQRDLRKIDGSSRKLGGCKSGVGTLAKGNGNTFSIASLRKPPDFASLGSCAECAGLLDMHSRFRRQGTCLLLKLHQFNCNMQLLGFLLDCTVSLSW